MKNILEGLDSPHIGPESEAMMVNANLEPVREVDGQQANEALMQWVQENTQGPAKGEIPRWLTHEVVSWMIEANPIPFVSPRGSAAGQRLMMIIVDQACQALAGPQSHLLQGASFKHPRTTTADISGVPDLFKSLYYEHGIHHLGDRLSGAMGDHLNLSLPTLATGHETTETMIQLTAQMRLIAGAVSIALSGSSPFSFDPSQPDNPILLTPYSSARLEKVWYNRAEVDVPQLFQSRQSFQNTLENLAERRILKTGGDVWIPVRPQATYVPKELVELEQLCIGLGIDPSIEGDRIRIRELIFERNPKEHHRNDGAFQEVERWRRKKLRDIISAPRTRIELRTLETPPAFEDLTPYEYLKALHSFFELLFIRIAQGSQWTEGLAYNAEQLQAAQENERQAMQRGMDAQLNWLALPNNVQVTARKAVAVLLKDMEDLAKETGRRQDLEVLWRIARGDLEAPAERLRQQAQNHYRMEQVTTETPLPDESFPKHVLQRNRALMRTELGLIEGDLPNMPEHDQRFIQMLVSMARELQYAAMDV